ncbi:MAG: LamG domain-containing protein [Ferruginibacter sp.]|nr:LamG domain-containing protein [Ferruginibacter sp.]
MYRKSLIVFILAIMLFRVAAMGQLQSGPQRGGTITAYYTRLPFDDHGFTGKFADIIISIKDKGDFVFSREYSYQPYWQPRDGKKMLVKRIIERKGDGPTERPDKNNICSNAAIVERNISFIKVHWRYAPDITSASFTDFKTAYNKAGGPSSFYAEYADEYFTVYKDGTVKREVKNGRVYLPEWTDPSNMVFEKLTLSPAGIMVAKMPAPAKIKMNAIRGAGIKNNPVKGAVLYFPLNEGLGSAASFTIEAISKTTTGVEGVNAWWRKGVSGTCLSFDSYSNAIVLPADKVPVLKNEFSIEAWVAPQEYPFNETAIADHISHNNGYFLGLDAKGRLIFRISGSDSLLTRNGPAIPLYKWSHVVACFSNSNGVLLYVNGKEVAASAGLINFTDAQNTALTVGRSGHKGQYPAGPQREIAKLFATKFVWSGLLDEVKVYDRALKSGEVLESYNALKPAVTQPLQSWVLPAGPVTSPGFGASYTKLEYSPEWDGLWRVGEYADLVVNFTDQPWRYVFWRGTRYMPSLVTGYGNKGIWSNDQSPEHYNSECFEHMSDMLCRYSNIRLISGNAARVVVHWRNSSVNVNYKWPALDKNGWGIWTDEYWTIYPDGVSVRHQLLHNGSKLRIIEMNQNEILHHPGQSTEAVLMDDAVTVSDDKGEMETFLRSQKKTNPPDKSIRTIKNLQYINLKSATKQFQIGEPGTKIDIEIFRDEWWNGWNHYPAQLIPTDGTVLTQYDRASSSCPATFREVRHTLDSVNVEAMTIYGLTTGKPEALTNLNRSWNFAPEITGATGCINLGYNKAEKAYLLEKKSNHIKFRIAATEQSPVVNPAFIIRNWGTADAENLRVKINGQVILNKKDYQKGIEMDTNGTPMLIIRMKHTNTKMIDVIIK